MEESTSSALFKIPRLIPFDNIGDILNILLTLAFFLTGVFFFFNLVAGGITWISAGGDPKALGAARARITNALIGLIIVVASYAIAAIVGQVFGLSIVRGFNFTTPEG